MMASAACINSSEGGAHCIIIKVYSKGAVDSPGINIKCWCTERNKEETPVKLKRPCFALA